MLKSWLSYQAVHNVKWFHMHICTDVLTDVAGAEFELYSCMCVLLAAARTESRMGPRLALTVVAQVPAWDAALVRPFLPQDLKLASHERELENVRQRSIYGTF